MWEGAVRTHKHLGSLKSLAIKRPKWVGGNDRRDPQKLSSGLRNVKERRDWILLLRILLLCWKWRVEILSASIWQICTEESLTEPASPSKTDQGTSGEAEVSVTTDFTPAHPSQRQYLLLGLTLAFLREGVFGCPFVCTHRWTREPESPGWWVHADHKSVDGFFSLPLRATWEMWKYFVLQPEKLPNRGQEEEGPPSHQPNDVKAQAFLFSRVAATWLWALALQTSDLLWEGLKG